MEAGNGDGSAAKRSKGVATKVNKARVRLQGL